MGDPLDLHTLLLYRDPTDALAAKRFLEERGRYAKIFPVPKKASIGIGGCGICVAVEKDVPVSEVVPAPVEVVELSESVLDAFFEPGRRKRESAGSRSR